MKINQIKIKVPEPCLQDPNKMPLRGNGLFCAACDKVVTDFSAMSDSELIKFLRDHSGQSICGVFRNTQLDKSYNEFNDTLNRPAICRWFMALLITLKLDLGAQESDPGLNRVSSHYTKPIAIKDQFAFQLRGKAFNRETKTAVSVTIRVHAYNSPGSFIDTVQSDNLGMFEINLPRQREVFYTLIFGDKNFQERKVVVDVRKLPKFLPVSLLPAVRKEVPEVPLTEADTTVFIRHEYITSGIPQTTEMIFRSRLHYQFWKIKRRVKRLFGYD